MCNQRWIPLWSQQTLWTFFHICNWLQVCNDFIFWRFQFKNLIRGDTILYHGGLWFWGRGSYIQYVLLAANENFLIVAYNCIFYLFAEKNPNISNSTNLTCLLFRTQVADIHKYWSKMPLLPFIWTRFFWAKSHNGKWKIHSFIQHLLKLVPLILCKSANFKKYWITERIFDFPLWKN